MEFVGNYVPCGLSPQTDGMSVILRNVLRKILILPRVPAVFPFLRTAPLNQNSIRRLVWLLDITLKSSKLVPILRQVMINCVQLPQIFIPAAPAAYSVKNRIQLYASLLPAISLRITILKTLIFSPAPFDQWIALSLYPARFICCDSYVLHRICSKRFYIFFAGIDLKACHPAAWPTTPITSIMR